MATGIKKSPLAPKKFPVMPAVAGVRLATAETGVKYHGRDDVLLAVVEEGARVAGVLTKSKTPGAPVQWCRRLLRGGRAEAPRALLVNAGNANTFTGALGARHVRETCAAAAAALGGGCAPQQVLAASTGVIGEALPVHKITGAMPRLVDALGRADARAWRRAAAAIATTDTFAKGAHARAHIGGAAVNIAGIAKGSGMIEPNMATMLAFVFTDAAIDAQALDACLRAAVDDTFHCITVDGDTSTSDTVLLFATGRAANRRVTASLAPERLAGFQRALRAVCEDLAVQIVRDGEGAQKLIRVEVRGAASDQAARRIAKAVANSPLVKTAIAGGDANWGRVAMAVGKAGPRVNLSAMQIAIGGVTVARHGARVAGVSEARLSRRLSRDEIVIEVDAGVTGGRGRARVWTCDLTRGYIDINADYRS